MSKWDQGGTFLYSSCIFLITWGSANSFAFTHQEKRKIKRPKFAVWPKQYASWKAITLGQKRGCGQKFLPCDLWGWTALDGTGEHDCHALPDGVSPQRDWKVWSLLTEMLQVLLVGRCLLLCLEQDRLWKVMPSFGFKIYRLKIVCTVIFGTKFLFIGFKFFSLSSFCFSAH